MSNVTELDELTNQANKRRLVCVAELMSAHVGVFGKPSSSQDWVELVQSGPVEIDADRQKIDKACGMVAGIFRTAQLALDAEPIEESFSPQRVPAVASLVPDLQTIQAMGGSSDNEVSVAFARSMTLYKKLVSDQVVGAEALQEFVEQKLDELPGSSPLHLTLVETAKKIIRGDTQKLLELSTV